jgi:hypothetical protein
MSGWSARWRQNALGCRLADLSQESLELSGYEANESLSPIGPSIWRKRQTGVCA